MAVTVAKEIYHQVKAGSMNFNLIGVGLADAWISPIEITKTWPDYLYGLSFLDLNEKELLAQKINGIEEMFI